MLEASRRALEAGRLREAVRRLPARVPGPFRPERDLIEAEALRGQGFFRRAEAIYRRLLAAPPKSDPPLWIEAALGSAAGSRSVGRAREASRLLDKAQALARRERWAAPRIRLERALIARAEGRWAAALAALRSMLQEALAAGELQEASFLLWAIGGALRFSGDLSGACRAFERSLLLAGRSGDPAAEGYAVLGLGGVSRILGRLRESARFYARARRAFARTEDLFAQAYAHCGLANGLRQLGLRRAAERHYRAAYRMYSRLGDAVDLAYVDWGLGKLRLDEGRVRDAVPWLRRSLARFRAGRELRGECLAELALAQASHSLGRTAEAEALFERAVRRGRAGGLHAHLELFT